MNKKNLHILLSLALIPLAACGQTPVSNTGAASTPAAARTAPASSAEADAGLVKTLTDKLEKTYEGQQVKVQSVRTTPIPGLYEVVVSGNSQRCASTGAPPDATATHRARRESQRHGAYAKTCARRCGI